MLHPDVVLGVVNATPTDLAKFAAWGYREATAGIYYLPGKIDPTKL